MELLGVIVILVVIFLLVFPAANNIINSGKETVYQTQINKILNAAYDYSLKNTNYLPDRGKINYVTLGELKYQGLIDLNIQNPETKKIFEDNLVVSIHNVGTNYEYSNTNSKLEGDYLYKVEKLPNNPISIEGLDGSDGNYVINISIDDENFNLENYKINTPIIEELLTPQITRYIVKNNQMVENIDISKFGVYKVHYSAVSTEENITYVNTAVLNIIIGDEEPPTINSLDPVTISKDVTSFDLLAGVTCKDNSGYCEISVTKGKIDFGVEGTYEIEYTAIDSKGNTITKERAITVK